MKVGTDGVLLGAWAKVEHCYHILDMGTGTGLVALMAAQRSQAHIVAIDLDADAVAQAAENVAASPWKERIQVLEDDARKIENGCEMLTFPLRASDLKVHNVQHDRSGGDKNFHLCFSPSGQRPKGSSFNFQLFDAILCNPPFFENSLKSPDAARTMARHTDTLSFDELARSAARLLAPEGELSVIIPYDRAHDMTVSAACCGLFATRQTIIVPVEGGKPKRILMAFNREGTSHTPETLIIQDKQRQYTAEYVRLVEKFYIKL